MEKNKHFPIDVTHILKRLLPTHYTSTCYWVILMNEMCSIKPLFQRFLIHLDIYRKTVKSTFVIMTNHQKSEDTRTVKLLTARYLKLCRIRKTIHFFYFKKRKKKEKTIKLNQVKRTFLLNRIRA